MKVCFRRNRSLQSPRIRMGKAVCFSRAITGAFQNGCGPHSRLAQSCVSQSRSLKNCSYNRRMSNNSTGQLFERLVDIMTTLRGPNGCPWDKEQDFSTLKPMLVEEVYEVLEAIDNQDFDGVSEELGDLLLHIVFQSQLGKEAGTFDINTVITKICDK